MRHKGWGKMKIERVPLSYDLQNSTPASASLPAATNLKFEREDWTSFRTIEGLQQKAGVSKSKLTRLVLKELADNGLDTGAEVDVGELPGGYFVEDHGPGIDGTPEDIARLFSICRPMVSTKLLRLPTRGALGNGLRVVAGAVLASGGALSVVTRNRRIELRPERAGTTTVASVRAVEFPVGTRVEINFGPALPCDGHVLSWARVACYLSRAGSTYSGKTSPWWYDVPQFHELVSASGDTPVRELVAQLEGCTGGKAGEIVAAAGLGRAACSSVTQVQARTLLLVARESARPVKPKRLGSLGPDPFPRYAYGCANGFVELGSAEPKAKIPFVVEAWASPAGETRLKVCVNRTPVTGDIAAARDKRDINVFGCGLRHTVTQAPKDAQFSIRLNITTPFIPITSDGKEPDLSQFLNEISAAVGKAVRKAHRPNAGSGRSQKDIVLDNLDLVIAAVSGDGEYRFNARQLFYGLRPIVMQALGEELKIGNFTGIIDDYEAEHGEIEGMYHEPRGSIYHPHRGETITLGTLMVEEYKRPAWTFNKLVYIEKEGASEALKDERWSEKHDCAIMSSKGFSTRAARDLIDKLADHEEPVEVFCVHDADASGTMIFQTLQEATRARDARKIQIINLGLESWEAVEMGLEVENVEEGRRRKPVAHYVLERDDIAPDGNSWDEWLQTHRVELNAMTTPEFIRWLDQKMITHGIGKLVPPAEVLQAELDQSTEEKVRAILTERILREAGLEDQVKTAIKAIKKPTAAALAKGVRQSFRQKPDGQWRDHIQAEATKRTLKIRTGFELA
jgi:hypothetical protein